MKQSLKILLITYVFFYNFVSADVPSKQVKEVTHLLAFVENSACIILNKSVEPTRQLLLHCPTYAHPWASANEQCTESTRLSRIF